MLAAALVLLLSGPGNVVAGDLAEAISAVPQVPPHDKVKVKDGRMLVRDKSKPVRRALEAQYAKVAEAQINEDLDALRALRTPDFSVTTASGEEWDLEKSLAYSKAGFAQVEKNLHISNTIDDLDVHDGVAVAVVHQRWSRMQMKAGKLRRVDTEAVQTETWVETPEGWKLRHIGNIKPGAWIIDGKRVDPGKPYDPDAPPFDPAAH